MELFTIALGGHACRVYAYADLYLDRYTESEVSGHCPPTVGKNLQDPSDSDLGAILNSIPVECHVRVLTSLQGFYSIKTLPKVLLPLRKMRRKYSVELLQVGPEVEKHLPLPQYYIGETGKPYYGGRFDVAISYASEDREVAERIATELLGQGLKVFFDRELLGLTIGRNLEQRLHEIYAREADLCIMLLSTYYVRKKYTMLELQAALERHQASTTAFLVPIKLDDTHVPELPASLAYVHIDTDSQSSLQSVVRAVAEMKRST